MHDDFHSDDELEFLEQLEEAWSEASLTTLDEELPDNLILYPIDDAVIFPGMLVPVDVPAVGDARTVVDQVLDGGRVLGFVTIKDERQDDDHSEQAIPDQLYRMGVIARVVRVLRLPDDALRLLCQTGRRFHLERFRRADTLLVAKVNYPPEVGPRDEVQGKELEVLRQRLMHEVQELVRMRPDLPKEAAEFVSHLEGAGPLADFAAANFLQKKDERQRLLETTELRNRVELALIYLGREREMAELGERLHREIHEKIEASQREFMIREQIKLMRRELGEERDEREVELERLGEALKAEGVPEEVREKGSQELGRLAQLSPEATEYNMLRNYLEWLTDVPWGIETQDHLDLRRTKRILDKHHYGLERIKERLLEFLAVRIRNPNHKGSILCLVGPPGTGKTSIALSIAEALGRKLHRVSLGGMRDEAEIKGHRRTYVGAMPGKIIQGLKRAGSINPVFVLDEIDKLGSDWRGDPSSAMLEVLDPSQNHDFQDHYLDVPCDLSKVLFIATANDVGKIPRALYDSMEIVTLDGYIPEQKLQIARRYLLPKALKEHALSRDELKIPSATLRKVIDGYTREAGVRDLNRRIEALARKATAKLVMGEVIGAQTVEADALHDWLGAPRFQEITEKRLKRPGIAVGLAWTPVGGDVLLIETTIMPGKGMVRVTGNLRQVMKESVEIALSYVRSRSDELGIPQAVFEQHNLHVHFPAGAVPKDGPSAGITIATALISLLTGRRAKSRIAMSGELTLRGEVMPVGGLREKVVAAKAHGYRTVVVPADNRKDIEEIPEKVRRGLTFIYAEEYGDLIDKVLVARPDAKAVPKVKKKMNQVQADASK
ncbi:MAG: endopeptidase La [Myxococcota bacterium]|nr:endopeptidase La [Myxococcota bacterium]